MQRKRRFKDRKEAGRELARQLLPYSWERPLIIGLPRGGVPVAYEVARELRAPLDVVAARKIGTPFHPEYGIGAIAPGDVLILETDAIRSMGLTKDGLERAIIDEMHEMERRIREYRSGEWTKDEASDTVILVDDGLATGITAKAALESIRLTYNPTTLVFASPVCARGSMADLSPHADAIVCAESPQHFIAVSQWYEHFPQVKDHEVTSLLEEAHTERHEKVELQA